jgi:Ni,Fe-hydrogenase III small subunit
VASSGAKRRAAVVVCVVAHPASVNPLALDRTEWPCLRRAALGLSPVLNLLRKISRTGRVTEPRTAASPTGADQPASASKLRGSVQVRQVDAGSCNGCEAEFAAAFGPVYDVEQFGVRLVASPRHADVLVVTGPVTKNMAVPLVKTFEATPGPKLVIALGDCARNCGVFAGGYGIAGSVADLVPVDIEVAGCPPAPDAIVAALRQIARR